MSKLAALSESDRQIALERFRLLQPHLEEGRVACPVWRVWVAATIGWLIRVLAAVPQSGRLSPTPAPLSNHRSRR